MTPVEAARLLAVMCTAWPDDWRFLDDDQQEFTRKLYRRMMRDLDAKACADAVGRLVATRKKMPKISELREATMLQMHGRPMLALEAWQGVKAAIAKEGRRKHPGKDFVFRDPVTARAVDAMGWHYLCSMEHGAGENSDRARFVELYDQLATQTLEDTNVAQIAPPLPRSQITDGGRHIRDIVAGLLPGKEQ